MLKYDKTYSQYNNGPSDDYPNGSAVNATSEDNIDGTPYVAGFFNDVIGFFQAVFYGVNGRSAQVSGYSETANYSDVWNALKKFVGDSVESAKQALQTAITSLQNALQGAINDITDLIPAQATTENQLADKNFVNSSIATNTANFIGTFDSLEELEAYDGTKTNNDYAFVETTDTAGNTLYQRYKYNSAESEWKFEYALNNTGFTAEQMAAINSGATRALIDKLKLMAGGDDLITPTARWLRFDPDNKTGLVIRANTTITVGSRTFASDTDTKFNVVLAAGEGSGSFEAGKDYYAYLKWSGDSDWSIEASQDKDDAITDRRLIGRFHTLCAAVPASTTMTIAAAPNSGISVGSNYLVKPYRADSDPDFAAFYTKAVTAISAGASTYDVLTMAHPLAGFAAGDILPESVWCLTWKPDTLFEDAMVYERATDSAVDVYLQSGAARNTRSAYGAVHTVNRQQQNHEDDMMQVGKHLLSDEQFAAAALGSNEKTAITGAKDWTTVGGHVDTASRRMTSAVGCEEMCGYLWQWLKDVSANGGSGFTTYDGRDMFGQTYGASYALFAGGAWHTGASCGSRARDGSNARSVVSSFYGGRGSSRVIRAL